MSARLSILYLASGGENSTAMMKARALQRMGHEVHVLNLDGLKPSNIWLQRVNNWTGYQLIQQQVAAYVAQRMGEEEYDIGWVDSGQMAGPVVIATLRNRCRCVINYNHDDPTGMRDGNVWASFKRAVPYYDLLVTVRPETEQELKALGAQHVLRVWRSYDEVEHRPRELTSEDWARWNSKVVFVGTWMPERGVFMRELVQSGIPLAIYGDFWPKAREWRMLKAAWRGPAVYGDDYAKAIQCSTIALGLLSKGNRDRHTTRSAEIPALGGLLCAERTDEHLQLFRENEEAIYWTGASECARSCRRVMADEAVSSAIRRRGREKVIALGLGHENVLGSILQLLSSSVRH